MRRALLAALCLLALPAVALAEPVCRRQQFLPGGKSFDLETMRSQQTAQGFSHARLVVEDGKSGGFFRHPERSWCTPAAADIIPWFNARC